MEIIRDWSSCRCVGIRLANPDGHIPYESCTGFSEEFLSLENDLSLNEDVCACIRVIAQTPEPQDAGVMTRRGSFCCNNTFGFIESLTENEQKRFRGNCVKAGFASVAVVPIRYRRRTIGAIHLADETENYVPVEKVRFLEDMAALIGEAVYRFKVEESLYENQQALRELTSELQLAEEKERRRIAQDLHDSIGQILSFSARELKSLNKSLPDKQADAIAKIGNQLDSAVEQARTLSFDLSPSTLYDLGFETAAEDLIDRTSREGKIRCSFENSDEPKPLADDVKVLLYRSVRELLINALKHAKAKSIKVSLFRSDSDICINIEDDGQGFDTSVLKEISTKPKGVGIFSIKERLNHIGGSLKIESGEGKGTRATLTAPLDIENEAK